MTLLDLFPVRWPCGVTVAHDRHLHTVTGKHFPFLARCDGEG